MNDRSSFAESTLMGVESFTDLFTSPQLAVTEHRDRRILCVRNVSFSRSLLPADLITASNFLLSPCISKYPCRLGRKRHRRLAKLADYRRLVGTEKLMIFMVRFCTSVL